MSYGRIEEVVRGACDLVSSLPGHTLISADKANLFATSRLWRKVVDEVTSERDLAVRHCYVDRLAFELAQDLPPAVVVTEGIFGDILSDVAGARAGSIALCSSASVNPGPPAAGRCNALYEPVHGSAPTRAGRGTVNPSGTYLALASALETDAGTRSFGLSLRKALQDTFDGGYLTYDLAAPGQRPVTTEVFSRHVNDAFEREV